MSVLPKPLGKTAFILLQHLYDVTDGVTEKLATVTEADAAELEISWSELVVAKDELVEGHFVTSRTDEQTTCQLWLTEEGIEAAKRHREVGQAIDKLRTKAVTLPPEMRADFESIVAEVEQKLREESPNGASLKVLISGLVETFETHVPEITTLLRQVGL